MDFCELVKARYSCRAYKPDPVDGELVRRCLEAARLAPTASNAQAFRLHVMPTAGRTDDLLRLYHRAWFGQAPLVIGIVGLTSSNWVRHDGRNYYGVDCAIVMDHLILQAADLGLGTCWVAAFDAAVARQLLRLAPDEEPVAFTPLGWPGDAPRPKQRKSLDELVVRP